MNSSTTSNQRGKSLFNSVQSRLPSWLTKNITPSSLKLLARAWIASWAAFLLIIPSHTLTVFGNAAFFACLSCIMIPPAYPVQIFFYAMALMVLGSLLGWAWGCIAMKVALVVRDQTVLLSELERAQQMAATAANPDAKFKLEVFQGYFLDTRASIIYAIFFAIGCFFFAISRAYSQKLSLFSVFGSIFLDIICSYGPLFPSPNYTILQAFLSSTAAYIAIGIVSTLLFFPESLNHQILNGVSKLLVVLRQLIEIQERVLNVEEVGSLAPGMTTAVQINSMTSGIYGGMQKLTAGVPMLSAEFSYGRLNGEDIKDLIEPLTILVSRIAGLQNFSKLVGEQTSHQESKKPATDGSSSRTYFPFSSPNDPAGDGENYLLRDLGAEKTSTWLQEILPLLHTSSADLRTACVEALRAADTFITHVNTTRWRRSSKSAPDLDIPLESLRRARDAFMQQRRIEVIAPLSRLGPLDKRGKTSPHVAHFYVFAFQANLGWCADGIIQLLEVLKSTAQKRPRARLWAPESIRILWKILTTREVDEGAALEETVAVPPSAESSYTVLRRDPDSNPPTNVFQHTSHFVHKLYKWCKTHEAIYAFKYTFISVALWFPSVFKSSAYINYVNKGVWALIMAQTTLEPFIADQIYSYVSRVTTTIAGAAVGLAAWYIGAGHGEGNPFGIAIVMGFLFVPLMFWRIFSPSILPPIMFGTTILLVVGYSWIDGHIFIVGNAGVGWFVAWRRWVLVFIGSGASGIIMFIPPKSARKAVRLANASLIIELSRLYGSLITRWITTEESETKGDVSKKQHQQMSKWSVQFRADFSAAGAKLQTLMIRTDLARWEGWFRGPWAVEKYNELNRVEADILSYLAQLASATYHLDPEWRKRLLHHAKFLNPNFITEVMSVFTHVSRSLKTGEPLLETLPGGSLIDRVVYHDHVKTRHAPVNAVGADNHWDQVRTLEFMTFATGVTAAYKICSLVDRLHAITRELCGQINMRGFAEWAGQNAH